MTHNVNYYNGQTEDSAVYYNEEYGPIADDFEVTKDMYFNRHVEEKSGKSISKKTKIIKHEEDDLRVSKNRDVTQLKKIRKKHRKQEYDEEHYALPYTYDLTSKDESNTGSKNSENQNSKIFFALFIWTAILGIVGGVIYFIYYFPESHGETTCLLPSQGLIS